MQKFLQRIIIVNILKIFCTLDFIFFLIQISFIFGSLNRIVFNIQNVYLEFSLPAFFANGFFLSIFISPDFSNFKIVYLALGNEISKENILMHCAGILFCGYITTCSYFLQREFLFSSLLNLLG